MGLQMYILTRHDEVGRDRRRPANSAHAALLSKIMYALIDSISV